MASRRSFSSHSQKERNMKTTLIIATTFLALAAFADDMTACPMHAAHMAAQAKAKEHANEVDERGDAVMGFSHETTKHSFKVSANGGSIEVRALRSDDETSIRAIRTHLQFVAK